MVGKSSTRLAHADVLAAMMDDLGNHRLEELARDDGWVSRHGQAPSTNASTRTGQAKTRASTARRNSLSEKYHAAIEDGLFDDDDAAGVNNLDPLDGGNAHRIKRRPFGQLHCEVQAPGITGNSKRPKYDPSQPTYHRKDKLRSRDPNVNSPARASRPLNPSNRIPHVSPLGAIVPDGGEVKRWDSGNTTYHVGGLTPGGSAGRGRPMSGKKYFPSAQSTQTTTRGHGRGSSPPKPPQMTVIGHNGLQKPQEVGQGRGKPTHPRSPPTNGSRPVSTTAVNTTAGEPQPQRSASLPQTNLTGPASKAELKIRSEASEARHLWEPPHLRGGVGNNLASSPASSQLHQPVGNITSLSAHEIFFQDNVLVVEQVGAENKLIGGRVVIYELLDAPVGVWELAIKDRDKVTRGDVRELLEGLTYGSTAYLRRHPQGCNVRSTPLRFSGIEEANNFVNELRLRKDQYAQYSEAIRTETSVGLSPAATHETTVQPPDKATHGTVVEPIETLTPKSGPEPVAPSFKTLQPKQPTAQKPNPEEPKLAKPRMERDLHNIIMPRPHTPLHSLFATKGESTTPKATAANDEQVGSGWDDKDLMSFSPEPDDRPSRSDGLSMLNNEQPVAVKRLDPEERVPQSVAEGEQEAAKKRPRMHAAEEVTKALRDVEVIEGAGDPSVACLKVLGEIPTDYTALIQKSALLNVALDTSPPDAAFVTALLHLVEVDGFLELSRDDQKSALAHVYAIIRHGNSPIIRSEKEILALRSGEEACPEAVKELNAFIKATQRGTTTQTVSGTRTLGRSPKPLGALMGSCWATNGLEETRQQPFATCGSLRVSCEEK
ncbi:hypothetical protein GGR58DRAFT_514009 [Xylaria digitata]|nr:hypothetical protein GGR58DRAFT_514009 [Xylaria digitata]